MGASLKKAGCGVPQIVLRDAALFKMIGSDKAAVGAEFSAPTAALPGFRPTALPTCLVAILPPCRLAVLPPCRSADLPICRPADLSPCRLYKRLIFAAHFSVCEKKNHFCMVWCFFGDEGKIKSALRCIFASKKPFFRFFGKNNKKQSKNN